MSLTNKVNVFLIINFNLLRQSNFYKSRVSDGKSTLQMNLAGNQ